MGALSVLRGFLFGIVMVFSVVVLAFTIFDQAAEFGLNPLDGLSLAAAVITLVFLPVTFILEAIIRSGATSLVPVELVRVFILWALWLASGAFFYAIDHGISASFCAQFIDFDPLFETSCIAAIIIPACSIINFFLLFVWFIVLLIFSAKNNHWKSAVNRVDLTKKRGPDNNGYRSNSGFVYSNPPLQQQPLQYYWVPGQQGPPPPVHLQGSQPPGQGQGYWVPVPPGQVYQGYTQQAHYPYPQQGYMQTSLTAPDQSHPGSPMNAARHTTGVPPLEEGDIGVQVPSPPSHSPPLGYQSGGTPGAAA